MMMPVIMIVMVVMMMAIASRAANLAQGIGQSCVCRIKTGCRFFDQRGNFLKAVLAGLCRPFNKLRLVAAVMLNPMGEQHP